MCAYEFVVHPNGDVVGDEIWVFDEGVKEEGEKIETVVNFGGEEKVRSAKERMLGEEGIFVVFELWCGGQWGEVVWFDGSKKRVVR